MIYFGFDLGDGESCVTWSRDLSAHIPSPIPVNGDLSFASAVGYLKGELVVGQFAAGGEKVEDLRVCFKRRFLDKNPDIDATIKRFVQGVLAALRQNKDVGGLIDDPDKACFIVGCPAGWTQTDRDRYRKLLSEAGMKNVRIASESRAAFENTLRCNPEAIDPALIEDSVLVIDIGSSTLDLAYVCDGQERAVEVMGDVKLGGGLMDEMILQYGLSQMTDTASAELAALLQSTPGWYNRAMYKARELKEQYFTNESYYFENNQTLEVPVSFFGNGRAYRMMLTLSPEIVENHLISEPHPLLDGQSFLSKLKNTLKSVHQSVKQREPKVVILTGGPSRMKFFRDLCINEFKLSRVIVSSEPEYDISRGLCYAGSVDEDAAKMIRDIKQYINSDKVEAKVAEALPDLIDEVSEKLADAMISKCALKALHDWKDFACAMTLNDLKNGIASRAGSFFQSDKGKELINDACTPWAQKLMASVQNDLDDIARKHNTSLSKLQTGSIYVDGGNTGNSPAQSIGKLITQVVGLITGIMIAMICGGAGTALIATGPVGIVIGILIAAVAFFLGKDYVEERVMDLPLPKLARKAVLDNIITKQSNVDRTVNAIQNNLINDSSLVHGLTAQISAMIDQDLLELLASNESQIVS